MAFSFEETVISSLRDAKNGTFVVVMASPTGRQFISTVPADFEISSEEVASEVLLVVLRFLGECGFFCDAPK